MARRRLAGFLANLCVSCKAIACRQWKNVDSKRLPYVMRGKNTVIRGHSIQIPAQALEIIQQYKQ
jgi:hypothetical protein